MKVILTLSSPEKWMLDNATYNMQKILNFFICVEARILGKKVKYVWSSQFPEAISTNMQIENDSFVFKYMVSCKENFKIHINFFEINVNVCLLCAVRVMTSIILHTERPVNKKSVTHLVFVSAAFHFSHFEKLKSTFFTSLHFAQRDMY